MIEKKQHFKHFIYQNQILCSFAYKLVCIDDKFS